MAGEAVKTMRRGRTIARQSIYEESSSAKHSVGDSIMLSDGRVFYYTLNGAVALTAGQVCQNAIPIANHKNIAVATAVVAGDMKVRVTPGATGGAANLYANGFLHCNDVAPEGHIYKIKSHLVITASTAFWVNLYDPVIEAMSTSSEVTLTHNPYSGVIVAPTTMTGIPVGVPLIDVTIGYYFWLQTWGPAPVLTDGTLVIGQHCRVSDGTAGAVEPLDRDGTAEDEPEVGLVMQVNATTEYSLVFLRLCP